MALLQKISRASKFSDDQALESKLTFHYLKFDMIMVAAQGTFWSSFTG